MRGDGGGVIEPTTVSGPAGSADPPELDATLRAAVDRVRRVPDGSREFRQTATQAARIHRIPPAVLERLLDLGLPRRGTAADPLFDTLDLENIGLALQIGPRWRVMLRWSAAFTARDEHDAARYTMSVVASCPQPGAEHACRFSPDPRLVAAVGAEHIVESAPGSYTFDICTHNERGRFGEPFVSLIDAVRPLEFHIMHQDLAGDLGFLRDSGLADCRLAAQYLIQLGRERGHPVRPAQGLLAAVPYPVWHAWVEFGTDRGWLAADPFLLLAFQRWGVVDPAQWPPERSAQGLVWRLHDRRFPLVTHDGSAEEARMAIANTTLATGQRGGR